MFNKAVSNGYLENNPALKIKRIKPPERLPLLFSKEEFASLLKVIDNQDWKDLVEFAVKRDDVWELFSLAPRFIEARFSLAPR